MNFHKKTIEADPASSGERRRNYQEAATWSADIHGALRASRRVAWLVAAAALVVAVLEAVALAALAPLKTVVPYAITVDRQTGYVETVDPLKPGGLSQDQAVTQSFLARYVMARETFDATDLSGAYHRVILWSAGDARDQYQQLMRRATPDSPLNLYSPTTVVQTTIKSVSMLSQTTAMVRFDTTRRDAGSTTGSQTSWAAVIAFRFSNGPLTMGDRILNPLGFEVTRYRRDAEALTPSSVPLANGFPPGPARATIAGGSTP
jgi:type IV secretion system protein VirB8